VLAGAADDEGVIVAELDFDSLRRIRARLPTLARRVPGAYDWSTAETVAPGAAP
jgi:predicted amidohydrolase